MSAEAFYLAAFEDFNNFVFLFMPEVLDDNVFSQQPRQLIETGDFKRCDILIGTNTLEEIAFVTRGYINMTDLRTNLTYNPGSLPYDFDKYYQRYNLTNQTGFYDKIIEIYGLNNKNRSADFYLDYVEILTDECFKCPTYLLAEQYSKFNQNAYVYMYGQKLSTSDWGPEDGAIHGEFK